MYRLNLAVVVAVVAVRTGKTEEAIRQIERWDLLTRKLQVGVFIRTGTMDAEAGRATRDLRERLEDQRDALLADDPDKAKQLLAPVEEAYRKCRDHYQPGDETKRRCEPSRMNLLRLIRSGDPFWGLGDHRPARWQTEAGRRDRIRFRCLLKKEPSRIPARTVKIEVALDSSDFPLPPNRRPLA